MIHLKSRRRLLLGLAAGGAAAAGGLFWNKGLLARMALQGQTQASKLKVVFYVIPDGFAVNGYGGPLSGEKSLPMNGLWYPYSHPPQGGVDAPGFDTSDFPESELTGLLSAYRSKSLYLKGLSFNESGYVGHGSPPWLLRGPGQTGASIDVHFGNEFDDVLNPGQKAVYATPGLNQDSDQVSYYSSGARNRNSNVLVMFDQLFGVSGRRQPFMPRSPHIFDPVLGDINQMRSQLAGAEREKLRVHLDSVEQVVKDLESGGEITCEATAPESASGWGSPDAISLLPDLEMTAFHRTVATALGCGISRVATVQVARSANSRAYAQIGSGQVLQNLHESAHKRASFNPNPELAWRESRKWLIHHFKSFLDELSAHADPQVPGENLLDHTLVVLTSEMADGDPETNWWMPVTFFGGEKAVAINNGNGTGRYLNIRDHADLGGWHGYTACSMPRLWNTMAVAAGMAPPYAGEVIPGIFTGVG